MFQAINKMKMKKQSRKRRGVERIEWLSRKVLQQNINYGGCPKRKPLDQMRIIPFSFAGRQRHAFLTWCEDRKVDPDFILRKIIEENLGRRI